MSYKNSSTLFSSIIECRNPLVVYNKDAWFYLRTLNKVHMPNSWLKHFDFVHGTDDLKYLSDIRKMLQRDLEQKGDCKYLDYYTVDLHGSFVPLFRIVGCGRCEFCKNKKSLEWQSRCKIESEAYDELPAMLTLTYDNVHLPDEGVSKRDAQLFLMRLRTNLKRKLGFKDSLRYILCSEYGSKFGRPHYHLLLWGLPSEAFDVKRAVNGSSILSHKFYQVIYSSWSNGYIYAKQCNNSLAGSYVCKYMRKDSKVPDGKAPTFFLSSRRNGGIGWPGFVATTLASQLEDNPLIDLEYTSKFDHKSQKFYLPYSFLNRLLPNVSSLRVQFEGRIFPLTRLLAQYSDSLKLYSLKKRSKIFLHDFDLNVKHVLYKMHVTLNDFSESISSVLRLDHPNKIANFFKNYTDSFHYLRKYSTYLSTLFSLPQFDDRLQLCLSNAEKRSQYNSRFLGSPQLRYDLNFGSYLLQSRIINENDCQ